MKEKIQFEIPGGEIVTINEEDAIEVIETIMYEANLSINDLVKHFEFWRQK